jgi:biopolymer transport protein ExbB/TolQ
MSDVSHSSRKIPGLRLVVWGLSLATGCVALFAMNWILPAQTTLAATLLDKREGGTFPFSIQSATWLVFFLGLGFVIQRWIETRREAAWLQAGLLPEDPSIVLQTSDLGSIYSASRTMPLPQGFMSRMVRRVIQQVQVSNSVEMGTTLLNSSLEMFQYEIDLRFNMIRYVMWLIPTLGFIGTVIGIADALSFAGMFPAGKDLPLDKLTAKLGVAFSTTLLALILAGVLVFLVHIVQEFEESTLLETGQYCLDHLINRIYIPRDQGGQDP